MEVNFKFLSILLLLFMSIVVRIQAKPAVKTELTAGNPSDEMMETAESQNPFLPRFAMKKLKEKRLRAQAQRRNNPTNRKMYTQPQRKDDCNQNTNLRRWYHNHRK